MAQRRKSRGPELAAPREEIRVWEPGQDEILVLVRERASGPERLLRLLALKLVLEEELVVAPELVEAPGEELEPGEELALGEEPVLEP